MYWCLACLCVFVPHACSACSCQKRALEPLELELHWGPVGALKGTRSSVGTMSVLSHWANSLAPLSTDKVDFLLGHYLFIQVLSTDSKSDFPEIGWPYLLRTSY